MDSPTSTGAGDSSRISDDRIVREVWSLRASNRQGGAEENASDQSVLRFAMRDSIRLKDGHTRESCLPGVGHASAIENEDPPESPLVVFINPHSGGRHGPMLKDRLQLLISKERVNEMDEIL